MADLTMAGDQLRLLAEHQRAETGDVRCGHGRAGHKAELRAVVADGGNAGKDVDAGGGDVRLEEVAAGGEGGAAGGEAGHLRAPAEAAHR